MGKVYVTDSAFPSLSTEQAAVEGAGHQFGFLDTRDPDAIIRGAQDADGLLVQFAPITDRVLEGLSRLKVMVRYGVGYDNFDLEAARRRGVIACNVPTYCLDEVADHTMAMILAAARRLVQTGAEVSAGRWRIPQDAMPVMCMRGKTLGLIGFGAIAKQVAKRALAFGMHVIASDPLLTYSVATEHGVARVTASDLWPAADFVSVHCPLNPSTRHIVNAESISCMKQGVVLINNGRGGLVDEVALYAALLNKHVGYAALDVLQTEPPNPNYRLLSLPNVLVTPHMASTSETSVGQLQRMAVDEIVRVLSGQPPLHQLYK
jgi:D-3-phosphoglycerate dehydrogenase